MERQSTVTPEGASAVRRLVGMAILALALCSALAAGTASADSRGFKVRNNSNNELTVAAAQRIVEAPCAGCSPATYEMAFEGRPKDQSTLKPGAIDDWELKHWFSLFNQGPHYAAELVYKINGTPAVVIWKIYTYNYSNESTCELHGELPVIVKFGCKAEGLKLDFHDASPVHATAAGAEPQTVAQFHHLAAPARRTFALAFMTKERVDPCTDGRTPLGDKAAEEAVDQVVALVKPGLADGAGGTIPGDAPVGLGIRLVLERDGC
ncbi:MAG: hypothetical protein JSS68_15665 [Actinobacteria bacterium]|nr:hypothetical protein [Actinomycetota bacterium]